MIFHTLRGLPKAFNGFKATVRTRGNSITFDELITILNGEDLQLIQGSKADNTIVLVANHTPQVQGSNPRDNVPQSSTS